MSGRHLSNICSAASAFCAISTIAPHWSEHVLQHLAGIRFIVDDEYFQPDEILALF